MTTCMELGRNYVENIKGLSEYELSERLQDIGEFLNLFYVPQLEAMFTPGPSKLHRNLVVRIT